MEHFGDLRQFPRLHISSAAFKVRDDLVGGEPKKVRQLFLAKTQRLAAGAYRECNVFLNCVCQEASRKGMFQDNLELPSSPDLFIRLSNSARSPDVI